MRNAEARITLGVVAAREGDLDSALSYGKSALNGDRKSIPSLLMVSRDLGAIVSERYRAQPDAIAYLDQLKQLREGRPTDAPSLLRLDTARSPGTAG
jgi:hypothetical protein